MARCEREGCSNRLPRRKWRIRFCCRSCASTGDGRLPPEQRAYLSAFEAWLHESTEDNLMNRQHALADLMSRAGIEA